MNNSKDAVKLFKEGYNCSQAVIGAYCDELGMDLETALRLSSSFGGGMGSLREVCGAVSSMFMVAGLKYGYADPKDKALKQKHYELIQELSQRFKEKNGSIICRELLNPETYRDASSTKEGGLHKKRPCVELVECAAEIIDDVLNTRALASY
ncbi:C_GCAxxG_C_C family probable redox protein [Anaerosolibacter carboniphilus]|uniref:C_GCAxxG_C_C family probable redox protein n=1 Tax=Anaerosolibacter carboniphilus TaxID=1417629 RepID=A0A841KU73_9FIRM|nr:C-GCAxxG-C-C family protein [Anaerosolibacter carboniphilus]MBB6214482.1 C_GCAxxG_C_C family probable redox protein [Anaerosolibacter carboniphilus]